jgi:hypothetical protein
MSRASMIDTSLPATGIITISTSAPAESAMPARSAV